MRDEFEDDIADIILESLRVKAARESGVEAGPEDARLVGQVALGPVAWPARKEVLGANEQLQHRTDCRLGLFRKFV